MSARGDRPSLTLADRLSEWRRPPLRVAVAQLRRGRREAQRRANVSGRIRQLEGIAHERGVADQGAAALRAEVCRREAARALPRLAGLVRRLRPRQREPRPRSCVRGNPRESRAGPDADPDPEPAAGPARAGSGEAPRAPMGNGYLRAIDPCPDASHPPAERSE